MKVSYYTAGISSTAFQYEQFHMSILTIRQYWRSVYIVALLVLSILAPVNAATYRFIGGRYLEIGNQWNYQVHVTLEDNVSVDKLEARTESVTGTKDISGHLTKIVQITDSVGTGYEYYDLTNDYLLDYGYDGDDGFHAIVINNNPVEAVPVWINTTDNNRLLGTGDYQLQLDDPYMVWTSSFTSYVTYVRQETVAVPAGTFDCIVGIIKAVYSDELGFQMEFTTTTYIDSEVGIIKEEDSSWVYSPYDGQTYNSESVSSLTWTNVKPSINKNITNYDFGDSETVVNFDIWNGGSGTLDYQISISEGQTYFSISPDSGSSAGIADKQIHTITLNRANIPYDETVTGKVKIESSWADNSPQFIDLSTSEYVFPNLSGDSEIYFEDLGMFAFYWMDDLCSEPNWCEECDFNRSGTVDFFDFGIFSQYWRTNNGPISHWKLDEGVGTDANDSAGSNHGTVYGATWTTGQMGGALDFDGSSDYVNCGTIGELTVWTVSLWANSDTQGELHTFITQDLGGANDDFLFGIAPEGLHTMINRIGLTYHNDDDSSRYALEDDQDIIVGQWYHASVTYDGTTMTLYVNGVEKDNISVANLSLSNQEWLIGKNPGTGRLYDGKIDDTRIYDRALTGVEIQRLYQDGLNL